MKIQISALINRAALLLMILLASVLMPFDIYAAGETQIVPTYTSSTTQQEWQTKLRINNYCEGTNASTASCKLSFYVTGPYYGIINIDGYDSSGSHWINGGYIFISDGYGEYNYNFYQNGIKQISSISIWGVQLFQPDSNVDLTQIIQLLTSINNYENSSNIHLDNIEDNTADIITEIRNVISNLIISNGYLETLTEMRKWDIPIESYPYVYYFYKYHLINNEDIFTNINFGYPTFKVSANDKIFESWINIGDTYYIISGSTNNYSMTNINDYFQFNNCTVENVERINYIAGPTNFYIKKITIKVTDYSVSIVNKINMDKYVPIYCGFGENVSTEFALLYGFTNNYLDNINIIANGTSQSNQQSQDLSSGTDSMQDQMDDLVVVEDSYNQQFNNSVNSIDFSNPLQQNQGLLGASNFVITVFNGLIANNPFSILIIIVCILLIGKKVIGK